MPTFKSVLLNLLLLKSTEGFTKLWLCSSVDIIWELFNFSSTLWDSLWFPKIEFAFNPSLIFLFIMHPRIKIVLVISVTINQPIIEFNRVISSICQENGWIYFWVLCLFQSSACALSCEYRQGFDWACRLQS